MDIWDYDRKTRVLLGRSAADPNPEEPGAWLIPAYATTIRPPSARWLRSGLRWRVERCRRMARASWLPIRSAGSIRKNGRNQLISGASGNLWE